MASLTDSNELDAFVRAQPMSVVYFTGPDCAVCKVLKPKLVDMLNERFPAIAFGEVDCALSSALAARCSVFALPTLIVFTAGKESLRRSRSFGLGELASELERPYAILCS